MSWVVQIPGGQVILVFSWVVMGIGIFIGSVRLVSRWYFNKCWRWSDIAFLLGELSIVTVQILTIVELAHQDKERGISEIGRRLKYITTLDCLTWFGLTIIRVSILLLFSELMTYRADQIAIGIGIGSCILLALIAIPVIMWACVPWISRYDYGDIVNSESICNMVQRPFTITGASVSLFMDLYVIAIPINRVARINMPRRKKVLVFMNVAIGSLAVTVSAARLGDVIVHEPKDTHICMRVIRNIMLCTCEGEIANIAGSLICLRQLMNALMKKWRDRRKRQQRIASPHSHICEKHRPLLPLWHHTKWRTRCFCLRRNNDGSCRDPRDGNPNNENWSSSFHTRQNICGNCQQPIESPKFNNTSDPEAQKSGNRNSASTIEKKSSVQLPRSIYVDGRNVIIQEGGIMGKVDAQLYSAMDTDLDTAEDDEIEVPIEEDLETKSVAVWRNNGEDGKQQTLSKSSKSLEPELVEDSHDSSHSGGGEEESKNGEV